MKLFPSADTIRTYEALYQHLSGCRFTEKDFDELRHELDFPTSTLRTLLNWDLATYVGREQVEDIVTTYTPEQIASELNNSDGEYGMCAPDVPSSADGARWTYDRERNLFVCTQPGRGDMLYEIAE